MTDGTRDIAIAVFRVAAAGGQERHALRLAEALLARGHSVTLYTTAAGAVPEGVTVRLIAPRGLSNHGRLVAFQDDLAGSAGGRHDILVGFQKMGGLDVLFCGDWCFADRRLSPFARILPRYRTLAALERACCGAGAGAAATLLMLAEPQAQSYRDAYPTAAARITILPPTLDRRRVVEDIAPERRAAARRALGLSDSEMAWFWLALQPKVKGLDRVIRALALSPGAKLFACGTETGSRAMRAALALARQLGCADRIVTPGVLDEAALGQHFLAADLLVHPARLDVTGTVIVEALGAGLPVIVTANCGYAHHVVAAGAGVVVPADAAPQAIAAAAAVDPATRENWSRAAQAYVRGTDLTRGVDEAAAIIARQAAGGARARAKRTVR